jgi:hypothetical protein
MRYLIPMLLILTACGSSPDISGIKGDKGDTGLQGPQGTSGSSSSDITSIKTCFTEDITYRPGTQIGIYYQEIKYSNGYKNVNCSVKYNQAPYSHTQTLAPTDSDYTLGVCKVYFDVNDASNGYWTYKNNETLFYTDSTSALAGVTLDIHYTCQ